MQQPNIDTFSCDLIAEIIADGSQPITPRPAIAPILSEEEKAFAEALKRYQSEHRRALLTWREIFEIVQSLGYRKVGQPPAPPQTNGDAKGSARADGTGTETPT